MTRKVETKATMSREPVPPCLPRALAHGHTRISDNKRLGRNFCTECKWWYQRATTSDYNAPVPRAAWELALED